MYLYQVDILVKQNTLELKQQDLQDIQ